MNDNRIVCPDCGETDFDCDGFETMTQTHLEAVMSCDNCECRFHIHCTVVEVEKM